MPNLPTFLGTSSASPQPAAEHSTHAQDFSTSKLNQHKDREVARVSMHQAISAHRPDSAKPTTSITHTLDARTAQQMDDPYHGYDEEEREEIRTRLRYQHIREMMREKKQQS